MESPLQLVKEWQMIKEEGKKKIKERGVSERK